MNRSFWMFVFAALIACPWPALAEDAAAKPCEPQPTCEFDNLVIKPGAPTTGVAVQDAVRPGGIDIQQPASPDLRGSYRLPEGVDSGAKLAR